VVVDRPGEPLPRRYSQFFQTTYEYERNYLFLDVLYDTTNTRGKGITSFFIRRLIYFAFFGRHLPGAIAEALRGRPPRNPEVNMTGESDGASPHNTESGPAPPQALVVEPLAQKRVRRDRPIAPPLLSQEQMALVPTL
jgi:hypothetical protein